MIHTRQNPVSFISYFLQLLEVCALHWGYWSALTFGQDVYLTDVYIAMAVRIRAIGHTVVVSHVCSREEVLGSNRTISEYLPNDFAWFWRRLRNASHWDIIHGTLRSFLRYKQCKTIL